MRKVLYIVVSAPLLVSCASGTNSQTSATLEPVIIARDAWHGCVRRSFAAQSRLTPDKELAAEQAFLACRTEEAAMNAVVPARIAGDPRVYQINALAKLKF